MPNHARRLIFSLLLASITSVASADISGKVVAIVDGDTIRLLDSNQVQHKIRLSGIDAPEKGQPYGNASQKQLAVMLAGKQVRVVSSGTDRYGRLLGKVWVQSPGCPKCGNTRDANLAQLESGMAWWYQYYASEQQPQDRERYKNAANAAKRGRLGLWADSNAIPPWAWRRGERPPSSKPAVTDLRCGTKRYCREMISCAEATFYLRRCGRTALDVDGDGLPCETICRSK